MRTRLLANLLRMRLAGRPGRPAEGQLTSAGLARACGVSPSAVSQWTHGNTCPGYWHLKPMAEYLNLPVALLRGFLDVDLGLEGALTSALLDAEDDVRSGDQELAVERICSLLTDILTAQLEVAQTQLAEREARIKIRDELRDFMTKTQGTTGPPKLLVMPARKRRRA